MERTLDAKGRWRNRTVGFRVSEEEAKMIDRMVALSGLTKQEYILRKLMDWEVTVQGNPRVYKALKNQMQQIYGELKRLEVCSEENEDHPDGCCDTERDEGGTAACGILGTSIKKKMPLLVTRTFLTRLKTYAGSGKAS